MYATSSPEEVALEPQIKAHGLSNMGKMIHWYIKENEEFRSSKTLLARAVVYRSRLC